MSGPGTAPRRSEEGRDLIRLTTSRGIAATIALCLVAIAMTLAIVATTADARWPSFSGPASVFGNDPAQGFHDSSDNGHTALGTKPENGGIAVNRPGLGWRRSWERYGGGWWWVCPPKHLHLHCTLLRQTDAGPSAFSRFGIPRVLDVTSAAARRAWRILVWAFPTDEGSWSLRYRGRHRGPG